MELDEKGRLKGYEPLHPEVYTFSEDFLDPALMEALRVGTREALLGAVVDSPVFGVFRFPCLRPAFCRLLLEELDHLERSGRVEMARPNSMNRYGAVLDQCGFRQLMDDICARVVWPIADAFFAPSGHSSAMIGQDEADHHHQEQEQKQKQEQKQRTKEHESQGLRYHHAFTVRYAPREDAKLAKHVDNSDITINVCLGREGFKGGHLLFQGCKDSAVMRVPKKLHRFAAEEQEHRVDHEIGVGLIHLGSHIHQAVKVEAGERINLIIWNKAEPF